MAVYNAEKYLLEQLESIIQQSEKSWKLYIRDDGSTDGTIQIVKEFIQKDNRIELVNDDLKHLGPMKSFMRLLKLVDSELYMFSDQDDYWLSNKIELSLEVYNTVENRDNIPVLVHTNVSVVDSDLNIIRESRWDDINLNPDKLKKYHYLAQCCYTQGSTMLFNKAAKKISFPVIDYAIMHDWWIATRCIKQNGVIKTIHTPTMLYRQHSTNVLGMEYNVTKYSLFSFMKKMKIGLLENIDLYKQLKKDDYGPFIKFCWYKLILLLHRTRNGY